MSNPKYTIDQLPELPLEALELGGKLEHVGTEPVLTIRPEKVISPEQSSMSAAADKRSELYVRKYIVAVTYPRVNCHPPNDLVVQSIQDIFSKRQEPLKENETDPEAIARHEQFYKLTSHNGVALTPPYFCRIHYGPWSAIVREQQSCDVDEPNEWNLFISGIPEVALVWYGAWEDIPAHLYPSLHVFMGSLYLVTEQFDCCPGYKYCAITNSCLPDGVECKIPDPPPV